MAQNCIKKLFLYDGAAGEEALTYDDWATFHIQDFDVAYEIAQTMLNDENGEDTNFDVDERVFEIYVITDRDEFVKQMELDQA